MARVAVTAAAVAGFSLAAAWSVRLACADYWFRKETPQATAKALALTPDRAEYLVRLALLVGDDDPARAQPALERAVGIDPNDGRAWVELGLRREESGDLAGAEQSLLRAAEADRTYLPRWTLLNYYFRRNDSARFWYWAKAAVPMLYGDPLPLFHLCGRVDEDGRLIERLDIRKPQIQAAYLFYLLDSGHAELAGGASRKLLAENREEDGPLLLQACDRLIDARQLADAEAIWDGLRRAGRLPFAAQASQGSPLTNGDFAVSPTGHGLDWRLPDSDGISAAREDGPAGLRLTFSGMQAERAEPLVQFVPVDAGGRYELRYRYRTDGISADSGLAWQVKALDGTAIAEGPELSSIEEADGRLTFAVPAGCRMLRLSLAYGRRPGTTRIAGYIVLRSVELRAQR
jgi:tetratricopeptide (TPR) repeat protein